MAEFEYLYFSQMSDSGKAKLEELINAAHEKLVEIFKAPYAAKENLMMDYKATGAAIALVGRLLQAETAMNQAMAVNTSLATTSDEAKKMLAANLPNLKLPEHKK